MLLAALLLGCTPPAQAPQELDALLSYLWVAGETDDTAAIEAGVAQLEVLLPNLDASADISERSAQLSPLPSELPTPRPGGRDNSAELAIAVWTASAAPLPDHAALQQSDDLTFIDESADRWDRSFPQSNASCLTSADCGPIPTGNTIERSSPVHRWTIEQPRTFRWVELDDAQALIGTAHTLDEAPSSVGEAHLYSQHELEVWWRQGSNTARVAATWSDASYGPLSDDAILSALIQAADDANQQVEAALSARR